MQLPNWASAKAPTKTAWVVVTVLLAASIPVVLSLSRGWSSSQASAFATWATFYVLLGTGLVVVLQLREAARLRREQTRPWVIVHFEFQSILAELVVRNIGPTVARNVRVRFRKKPQSALGDLSWLDESALFSGAMPVLPPDHEVRTTFDRVPDRLEQGLPLAYDLDVSYNDAQGRTLGTETYHLDLRPYIGTRTPRRGLADLADSVEEIRKLLKGWTNMGDVIVHVKDRDSYERRRDRPARVTIAVKKLSEGGLLGLLRHLWASIRRQYGLHTRGRVPRS